MKWMLLPIKRYADFKGRSRRMEYWMFMLFQFLVFAVVGILLAVMFGVMGGSLNGDAPFDNPVFLIMMLIFGLLYLAVFFIPGLAVTFRRWHDQDKTAWFILIFAVLGAIPVVGFLASIANIVFMCLPGTVGPNKYGEDPMQAQHLGDVFS